MPTTNYDRVAKALDLLRQGLKPFVEREMQAALGDNWFTQAAQTLRHDSEWQEGEPHLDVHALLILMWENWQQVFRNTLGHAERSLVSELREVRNRWAHQQPFSSDDAYRALDSVARLLTAVSAPEAQAVEQEKQELLRLRFEEQARKESRRAAVAPVEGRPNGGLRPWREIVMPHPDVASGRYLQAEFAADLWQVYLGEGAAEYRDPVEFFRRTFLTDGLHRLLVGALQRLSGRGGDPVIELQTNFGGGKTHSLLALYHLFSGASPAQLQGIEPVLQEAGSTLPGQAHRAVLVGNKISPGQPAHKDDGTVVNTLWGELAYQLGGPEGYAMVCQADETATNPGDDLRKLFNCYAPCLVLVDEWVAYARQLHDTSDLPAGSFGTHFTFAQTLTEAAKAADRTLLVVSMPASAIEVGGERGKTALAELKNAIGRLESSWRPASAEEGFEIVRRRLFQPISDASCFAARDTVVSAFGRLYREQASEFSGNTREGDYERRIRDAYPIHPELFDRLYSDWSSLEKFQRTRGVLRLMAAVIHALWERGDGNLLILPATIPIDDASVQAELTRYLEDNWIPVIEKDVDGPSSLPLTLDRENPNLGRYSACRRVARAVYMGSAPTAKTRNPGLDERAIKLGCVQPGESVATFGDALRRLTDKATHLYVDRSRYWFNTQPSVTRLADDRAAQFEEETVWEELKSRLRGDRQRGDFAAVHAAPESHGDVPDDMTARLVLLGPRHPHAVKAIDSPALQEAQQMLKWRGNAPRLYQNMLVFLAPDRNRLAELEEAIRQYLAWKSIDEEKETLNLDAFQSGQASTKKNQADETVAARIKETYSWLLVPFQSGPRNPDTLEIQESRLQVQDALAVQAGRKLKSDEGLITQFGAIRLRMALDQFNLWQGTDHVGLKQLWEYFARYPYLPRLKDQEVLVEAVKDGILQLTWRENFAYAEGWDEQKRRYRGLKAGQAGAVMIDSQSLLVRPEAADRQLQSEREEVAKPVQGGEGPGKQTPRPVDGPTPVPPPLPAEKKARRFYGVVTLDPVRLTRDAGQIADEVVQHLSGLLGAEVEVTLEIHVRLPEGVSEQVIRTVSENAKTLKFEEFGFEEE